MYDVERFKNLLKTAIGSRTNVAFAQEANISTEHLSRILNNPQKHRPTRSTLNKIAGASLGTVSLNTLEEVCGYTPTKLKERKDVSGTNFRKDAGIIYKEIRDTAVSAFENAEGKVMTVNAFVDEMMKRIMSNKEKYGDNMGEIAYSVEDFRGLPASYDNYIDYDESMGILNEEGIWLVFCISFSLSTMNSNTFETQFFVKIETLDGEDDDERDIDYGEKVKLIAMKCENGFYSIKNKSVISDGDNDYFRSLRRKMVSETAQYAALHSDEEENEMLIELGFLFKDKDICEKHGIVCNTRPCSVEGVGIYVDNLLPSQVRKFIIRHHEAFVRSDDEQEMYTNILVNDTPTLNKLRQILKDVVSYNADGATGCDIITVAIANIIYRETGIEVEPWGDKEGKYNDLFKNRESVMITSSFVWDKGNEVMQGLTENTARIILDNYASEFGRRVEDTFFVMEIDY